MFTNAERNLFDDGINQASSVKRYITLMSNWLNVLQHNSGEQPPWRIKPANGNTVLAFFIPTNFFCGLKHAMSSSLEG
jgi:phage baseplate assembly protein gpV